MTTAIVPYDTRIKDSAEQFAQRIFESCNSNKVGSAASNCFDLLRMQNQIQDLHQIHDLHFHFPVENAEVEEIVHVRSILLKVNPFTSTTPLSKIEELD